jgi:hypothetical protein
MYTSHRQICMIAILTFISQTYNQGPGSLTMAKVEFAKYTKSVPAATELITIDLVRIHS